MEVVHSIYQTPALASGSSVVLWRFAMHTFRRPIFVKLFVSADLMQSMDLSWGIGWSCHTRRSSLLTGTKNAINSHLTASFVTWVYGKSILSSGCCNTYCCIFYGHQEKAVDCCTSHSPIFTTSSLAHSSCAPSVAFEFLVSFVASQTCPWGVSCGCSWWTSFYSCLQIEI